MLVAVFPNERVLPLPLSGDVIGREWLEQRGAPDPKVSRAHLRFDRGGGVLHVADVGSSNGTWVNGQRLEPNVSVRLDDCDVLRVGRSVLVYRDSFMNPEDGPSPPLGDLVGPFGLAGVRAEISHAVSPMPSNVLILGETGTGKELVAREVARRVGREKGFVAINVAGVAPTLFESQMFGHVRGAFTGADRESKGVFLSHDGGAVFLDEIGDLAAELQARLLRLLDNREVLQVGASDPRKVDVVVISATHRDLAAMVAKETFRADLLARLRASRIDLPPLRERREDILAIALATAAKRGIHYDTATIEPEAVERLLLHSWPANVRELARTMEQVASRRAPPTLTRWALDKVLGPMETKITLTTAAVDRALAAAHGNQSEAARKLGVDRPTLLRHLAKRKR